MRQQAPRTPTPQDRKDTIEDFALGVLLRSSSGLPLGHIGLDQLPLLVTQVGRVRFSGFHTANGHQSWLPVANFLKILIVVHLVYGERANVRALAWQGPAHLAYQHYRRLLCAT